MHAGRYLASIDAGRATRRDRDEELFREWHRRPDALPFLEDSFDGANESLALGVQRSARSRAVGTAVAGRAIDRLVGWGGLVRRQLSRRPAASQRE